MASTGPLDSPPICDYQLLRHFSSRLRFRPWRLHSADPTRRAPVVPADGEPAASAAAPVEPPADAAQPHKTPAVIQRSLPVASGAARAKLERQRKRPF